MKMGIKEKKILKQYNYRATMLEMEVGEYFDFPTAQKNTMWNYSSMMKMGGRNFKMEAVTDKITRITRIK